MRRVAAPRPREPERESRKLRPRLPPTLRWTRKNSYIRRATVPRRRQSDPGGDSNTARRVAIAGPSYGANRKARSRRLPRGASFSRDEETGAVTFTLRFLLRHSVWSRTETGGFASGRPMDHSSLS